MQEQKSAITYLSKERFAELEKELRELKGKGRREIAFKIAEARGHGDLSENAEYDAAKEAQQHLEYKIAKLEDVFSRARIINGKDLPIDKVYILAKVKLKDLIKNKIIEFKIVAQEEADFDQNKISLTSPIGKSLLGKKVKDIVDVKVPAGNLRYEILEISR
ncbi:MAG: transcription elongation factor GreA [Bacteroidetes bacterium]|nr:transcription elongation factor GreA [Bacteroidota bacterium]